MTGLSPSKISNSVNVTSIQDDEEHLVLPMLSPHYTNCTSVARRSATLIFYSSIWRCQILQLVARLLLHLDGKPSFILAAVPQITNSLSLSSVRSAIA
jgi:hypothetical protein